jgi:hypothetical protein
VIIIKPTSQQKKKFEEERARRILKYLFPEKYSDTSLSESPDIITNDKRTGVEVTDSGTSKFSECLSRAGDISGKTHDELTAINKKNMSERKVTVTPVLDERYLAGFTLWGDTHQVKKAYEKKCNILNSKHFEICKENNLFITAWLIDDVELFTGIEEILKDAKKKTAENNINFDIVYIWTTTILIEIDMATHSIKQHTIPEKNIDSISHDAFYAVFDMTKEEYYK